VLAGQARAVNEREFLDCYDRLARDLLGFFARRTGDSQLAMDLLADTFLAAFEQRQRCRAATDAQRAAWVYRIAASKLADHFRGVERGRRALGRLGSELRVLNEAEVSAIGRLADSSELEERVMAAFGDLSDEQRTALDLHVIQERPYVEVSRTLQISEPAARARVSRGIRALRRSATTDEKEQR
jgi:RNA polymerase sigma factor (sigma-70 family)